MNQAKEFPKYSHVQVLYHIWLETENNEAILDDDTWELLKAIALHGSLVKAAVARNISYRKAWGDLKRTEELLGFALIEKHRGGANGGESKLSQEGQTFIEAFSEFHLDLEQAIQPAVIKFKRKIKCK